MLRASGFQCGDFICNLLRIEGIEFIISIRKSASMFQVELDMMIIEIIAAYAKTKWDFIVLFIYSETLFCFSI